MAPLHLHRGFHGQAFLHKNDRRVDVGRLGLAHMLVTGYWENPYSSFAGTFFRVARRTLVHMLGELFAADRFKGVRLPVLDAGPRDLPLSAGVNASCLRPLQPQGESSGCGAPHPTPALSCLRPGAPHGGIREGMGTPHRLWFPLSPCLPPKRWGAAPKHAQGDLPKKNRSPARLFTPCGTSLFPKMVPPSLEKY